MVETDFCWVFFYNSEEYLRSGDGIHLLAGNAPIIVLKADGSIRPSGTAASIEVYLGKLRNELENR